MITRNFFIVILFSLSSLACSAERPVIVLMEYQQGQKVIYVDGTVTDEGKIYETLMKPLSAKGRNAEVKVLFNPDIGFSEVVNAKGIIQAVGFSNIKFYYLSEDKHKMAEVGLNQPAILVPNSYIQ